MGDRRGGCRRPITRDVIDMEGNVKRFVVAGVTVASLLAGASTMPARAQEVVGAAAVTGAGSTFAYPIVLRWAKAYQRWVAGGGDYPTTGAGLDDPPVGPVLDYEPVGSLAGILRARTGAVDFGASDKPLDSPELQKLGLAQFPIVIGGIVAAVNIEGIGPGELRFTGEILANIFLGKIQTWADPAIKALNPDAKLPDAKITVIHRSDGSGTTFNFTNYLSKVSPEWQRTVGSDLLVPWPTGTGARGTQGVANSIKQTRNSIGYLEFANAVQNKLSYGLVRNQAGTFVKPEGTSFQAAAANADWSKASDFHLLLIDTPGESAYPIVATVFVLMPKAAPPRRTRAVLNFIGYALDKRAQDATELGYVPLPQSLITQIKDYWAKNLKAGT